MTTDKRVMDRATLLVVVGDLLRESRLDRQPQYRADSKNGVAVMVGPSLREDSTGDQSHEIMLSCGFPPQHELLERINLWLWIPQAGGWRFKYLGETDSSGQLRFAAPNKSFSLGASIEQEGVHELSIPESNASVSIRRTESGWRHVANGLVTSSDGDWWVVESAAASTDASTVWTTLEGVHTLTETIHASVNPSGGLSTDGMKWLIEEPTIIAQAMDTTTTDQTWVVPFADIQRSLVLTIRHDENGPKKWQLRFSLDHPLEAFSQQADIELSRQGTHPTKGQFSDFADRFLPLNPGAWRIRIHFQTKEHVVPIDLGVVAE